MKTLFSRALLTTCVVTIGAGVSVAQFPTLTSRPKPVCGLPNYPYTASSIKPKPMLSTTSLNRIDLGDEFARPAVPGDPTLVPRGLSAATFQMPDAGLRIDNCSVSRASIVVAADGRYVISFRADQGPLPTTPTADSLDAAKSIDTTLETRSQKRNQFHLTIRAYVGYPLPAQGNVAGGGFTGATKSAVAEFKIEPFWVARGVPYSGLIQGISPELARYYRSIDRFELDFTYR